MKRQGRVFMWLDNASDIDILFYEPYARIIADIAKNEQYNPLTVGVFGLWGAGKSTLLNIISLLDNDYTGTLKINNLDPKNHMTMLKLQLWRLYYRNLKRKFL